MNGTIHTWFPRSLYVADDCCLAQLTTFETVVKNIITEQGSVKTGMLGVNSSHKTFDQLQTLIEFKDLVDTITVHSNQYLSELGYNQEFRDNVHIANMWCNISHEGDFIFPHVHSNSILSGAFYIKKFDNSKIKFFNNLQNMLPRPQNFNSLNYEYCDYDCNPGRLLLFPSDLVHGTERQTHGEKIVISFNLEFIKKSL
jgi:uncharacterized protein (TIGR02466 family)